MVSKITIFEPHFHDAQFGPTVHQTDTEDPEAVATGEQADEESTGRSRLAPVLVLAIVAVAGIAIARRLRGGEAEFDAEAATEIEVEV